MKKKILNELENVDFDFLFRLIQEDYDNADNFKELLTEVFEAVIDDSENQ